MRSSHLLKKQSGIAVLTIVLTISAIGIFFLFQTMTTYSKNQNLFVREKDGLLLNEATMSTFAVMEAALARRMWEPPPNASCLKSQNFSVNGEFNNGLKWKVNAVYNPKVKNFELTAEGIYKGQAAKYKKYIKVIDGSDYLLFSASDKEVVLGRLYDPKSSTGMIARDRRIFTKGPISFLSSLDIPNPKTNFAGQSSPFPDTYGTIIQGDRMQFAGGIRYRQYYVPEPQIPPETSAFKTILSPYSNAWGAPDKTMSQWGGGVAVITKNATLATNLQAQVANGTGALTKASIINNVYPFALFAGSPPMTAWTGADTGAYLNDPDKASIFYYEYGAGNAFGMRANFACFSKPDALTAANGKYCSSSESFPNGFKNWRANAGLNGYLFTTDAETIPAPKFGWDNLQALEEDAIQCGFVLNAPSAAAYEDCNIWDKNFLSKYQAANGGNVCDKVSPVDLDLITLNNFNAADLTDASKTDLLLRRVVYLKVPAEVRQTQAAGFMTGALTTNAQRANLALWVVSEDLLSLKGVQPDTSSPLASAPGNLRPIFFNYDTAEPNPALKKSPLKLVLLSPEQIHLLSPQYVPSDYAYMQKTFPVVGGKIQPIRHIRTDYLRQENDGFKYGYRRYYIHDTTLLANSAVNPSYPFYLRGLWSGPDSSSQQYISNLCMISKPGYDFSADGTNVVEFTSNIGSYAYPTDPNSPIPASTSNYYGGLGKFPTRYYPQVFWAQQAVNAGIQESQVQIRGLRIFADFESLFPPTKRDLSVMKYAPIGNGGVYSGTYDNGGFIFDLSQKHFRFSSPYYYQTVSSNSACVKTNAKYITPTAASGPYDPWAVQPVINEGRHVFSQVAPANTYRNVGSLVGVEMPIIEVKK